ncbi:hypothetical protein HIM_10932 [Hirsutella minnesotensis 3608]|uniref:Uncharacterized protein n=1 Tax=Hirsutella minnesotensis 3608 TaxID=1043627 RepID=A0A0F7ZJJ4_9HYPO|nr:hypothetical protein HIM_10932 [Hirsutella minnesotensis 3608]
MKDGTAPRTILTEPQDWDRWIKELRARVDRTIYHLTFQDGAEPLDPPQRPSYSSFAQNATAFTDLSTEQQKSYSIAASDYESRRREFLYETKLITAAKTTITESISKAKLISLREEETLRQWVKKLEASTAPTKGFMLERTRKLYSAHLNASKKSFLEWLARWEEIMEEADLYFLTEALTGQWLRDIAAIIRPYSDGYATIFQEESKKIDEEAALAQYRVYQSLRPGSATTQAPALTGESSSWNYQLVARKIREILEQQPEHPTSRGVKRGAGFLAGDDESSEEQPPKKKRGPRTRCEACGIPGHELSKCWTVFEELRPAQIGKNNKAYEKVQKALKEDPSLQKKVNQIRITRIPDEKK